MIRVVIEVSDEASSSRVVVRARSLTEAASMAAAAYPKADDVRVKFPIDPEDFFAEDSTALGGIASFERAGGIAA